MLPALNKHGERQYKAADTKLYHPPRELSQEKPKRDQLHQSSRHSAKGKVGGGFKLSNNYDDPTKTDSLRLNQYVAHQSKTMNYVNYQKKSSTDLNQEIKMIEKKIRQCQKKIEDQKKRKNQQQRKAQENRYNQDFQDIIRKEMKMQGYQNPDPSKNFDYLTNPGGAPQQEEQLQEQIIPQAQPEPYSIAEGIEKLERFYQNSLKKKFERREAFPHKACRRKTPKLYITQKTNALNKHGKPLTEQQHKFRVITKQTTPQEIYPVIPNFAVVKDNLSKNIVAYLGDYKPFIDKTKEKVDKELKQSQNDNQEILIQNSSKIVTVTN